MPIALRCMLHVEKLTLSGGQQTDVIQAQVCTAFSERPLINLPTIEGNSVNTLICYSTK